MSTITCPNCRAQVLEGAAFCDNCGAPLAEAAVTNLCPNCRSTVRPDALFCDHCGHDLSSQSPTSSETLVLTYADLEPSPDNLQGPRLLVLPGENVLELPADQATFVIGRVDPASGSYPDVDLVPFGGEEGGVSRRHAQIIWRDDLFFIEDLNSVNYTFVNKNKIAVGIAHPLEDGDEIRLGRILLRFKSG